MENLRLYYAATSGQHISDAIATVAQIMRLTHTPVAFYFNGTFVECKPEDTVDQIGERWMKERGERR